MQIWKWVLVFGILFLITYNPASRGSKVVNYFTSETIGGDGQFPKTPGTAQKHSYTSDDD